jgi:phospholipase/lecithinase/hemolysin
VRPLRLCARWQDLCISEAVPSPAIAIPGGIMHHRALFRRTLGVVLVLFVSLQANAAQPLYGGFVVFGTSLSDPGNAYALRGGNNTPPDYLLSAFLVPGAPYARGGHHLTNGAPWVVQLARSLGLSGSVQPAYRSESGKAANYAVDGARARDDGRNVNLTEQVTQFLADHSGNAPVDRLYIVEIGSNDVRDAFELLLLGADGGAALQAALESLSLNLQRLYAAGARQFLVVNVPDIALTPAIGIVDSLLPGMGVKALATSLVQTFNAAVDALLMQLPPDADIKRLDVFSKLYDIVADPAGYGLTDVVTPCLAVEGPPFSCRRPDDYLFWDGIHPTKAGHAIFAEEARDILLH